MLIEFFKKLESSKWYTWGPKVLIIIFLLIYFQDSEMQQGLEIIILFALPFVGVLCGKYFAPIINALILKGSKEFGNHLGWGLSAFAFVIFPFAIGTWTNHLQYTDIEFFPFEVHFLFASLGGMVFFAASHFNSET